MWQSVERLIVGIKFIVKEYNDSSMEFDNSRFGQKKAPPARVRPSIKTS